MSIAVRNSANSVNNTIKKNNLVMGGNTVGYGPTQTTGFFSAKTIPSVGYSGYVIYETNSSGRLRMYEIANDSDLITAVIRLGGTATTVGDALVWLSSNPNFFVLNKPIDDIVTNGLLLHLDASQLTSYPKSGNTWYDLSGFGYHGSLVNGPTFNGNDRGGSITFDAVNDYATFPNPLFNLYSGSNNTQQVWTVNAWVNLPSATSGVVLVNGYNSPNGINLGLYLAFYTGGAGPTYYLNWTSNARFLYGGQNKIIDKGPTNVTFTLNCPANSMVNYINGAVDTTYTSPAFTPAGISQNMFIAGQGNTAAYSLYSLQIYNRALSATEVLQNYNATKGRYGL